MKELASRPEEGFAVLLKHDKPDVQRPSWLLGLVHQSPDSNPPSVISDCETKDSTISPFSTLAL